jgi:hypothetical protein
MKNLSPKDYRSPEIELGEYIPAIICESLIDGGSEDLSEENWEF